MPYAPDYGRRLMEIGVPPDVDLEFSDIPLFSIDVFSNCQYCSTVNIRLDGKEYAVTFDFNDEVLEQILFQLADQVAATGIEQVVESAIVPSSIQLDPPLTVNVTATLGTIQRDAKEDFVPLVIRKVEAVHQLNGPQKETALKRRIFNDSGVDQSYRALGFLPTDVSMQLGIGDVTMTATPHGENGAVIVFDLAAQRTVCRYDVSLPAGCSPERIAELIHLNLSLNFPNEANLWKDHLRRLGLALSDDY